MAGSTYGRRYATSVTAAKARGRGGAGGARRGHRHPGGRPGAYLRPLRARRQRGGAFSGHGDRVASARGIVEQHGGTIAVESTEGVGSTFTVRLPLADSAV